MRKIFQWRRFEGNFWSICVIGINLRVFRRKYAGFWLFSWIRKAAFQSKCPRATVFLFRSLLRRESGSSSVKWIPKSSALEFSTDIVASLARIYVYEKRIRRDGKYGRINILVTKRRVCGRDEGSLKVRGRWSKGDEGFAKYTRFYVSN